MKYFLFIVVLLMMPMAGSAQLRTEYNLKNWMFSRDSITWEQVRVPHDWAISGPFDKKWDLQMVAIEQNNETQRTEKSGRSGALPWIGEGFYSTNINIDNIDGKHATLVFDGAMAEPTVTVNGQQAGYWAYGYNTFRLDVTPLLRA
ncbi:MAG: beta-galactosidase, partial [Prevotella sp.]|nr:beta-galactosidase [Prevotella sp.]